MEKIMPYSASMNLDPIRNEQRLFRFENGFGARVIRGRHTYGGEEGLFELAVIHRFNDDGTDFALCYSTPITEDVEGHLTEANVQALLHRIRDLPPESIQ